MDKDEKIKELEEKNAKLEEDLQATKEHLKKYTALASRTVYFYTFLQNSIIHFVKNRRFLRSGKCKKV